MRGRSPRRRRGETGVARAPCETARMHDAPPPAPDELHPATRAAHGVRAPSPEALPEGLRARTSVPPLFQSAAYDFESVAASETPLGGDAGYAYARYGHPNARSLELTVAALEGADDAVATASGMAAIGAAVLSLAQAGDHVFFQRDAYGGTLALFRTDLARGGVQVHAVDAYDVDAVRAALARRPRLLLVETLSNPLVRPVDVPALAAACRAAGTRLVVDASFTSPAVSRPLAEGADLVVHSVTKFLGGHHDVTAGVVCGPAELVRDARRTTVRMGARVPPFEAWLALRGIATLTLRMERAQENARALAAQLRADARVAAVHHPGYGALLSFDVGSRGAVDRFLAALRLVTLTPSFGGVTTTLSHAASSSHRGLTPEERAALGIGDGLLRLSCGIEDVRDVAADLTRGLNAL